MTDNLNQYEYHNSVGGGEELRVVNSSSNLFHLDPDSSHILIIYIYIIYNCVMVVLSSEGTRGMN